LQKLNRRFGDIPEALKTGQITLKNYNYRAEWHITNKPKRPAEHPTISPGTTEFALWFQYFQRHLGGLPWAMRAVLDRKISAMTVPELRPEWFDPSFEAIVGYQVKLPRDHDPPADPQMAARFDALLKHLGSKKTTAPRKSFQHYTADELTARYAPAQQPKAE
jgi:hypothetical protein